MTPKEFHRPYGFADPKQMQEIYGTAVLKTLSPSVHAVVTVPATAEQVATLIGRKSTSQDQDAYR